MSVFSVSGDSYTLDGKPFRILSGAIHYFRVVPEYWEDRLKKLKACGLNTVETYIPWNLHEPKPGRFCFEGMLDLERFLDTAAALELKVILRPGPYMCSEWEFGGLPGWLLADENMRLRCNYGPYLQKVDAYFDVLIPKIVPHLCTHGGPVIAVQVENEYGSYGNDKQYLRHIRDGLVRRGVDCLLFTSDGPQDDMLTFGTLPDVHKMVNFGSDPQHSFPALRKHQPVGPMTCCEFWLGWFDHWGIPHRSRDTEDAAKCLDEMLDMGANVNLYMFHGGTNFGFMNGALAVDGYNAMTTSYDYDAPVSECGDLAPKFYAFRKVLEKHFGPVQNAPAVCDLPKKAYGTVKLTEQAALLEQLDDLSRSVHSPCTLPMERVGQSTGFILYRTTVTGPVQETELSIQEVRDRAIVFVDGQRRGVIYRDRPHDPIIVSVPAGQSITLDVLVENMGRVNYGPELRDNKGVTEGIRLGRQFLFDWTIYPLPLDDLKAVAYQPQVQTEGPVFLRGHFRVEEKADTFLYTGNLGRGAAYLNGFNLGRYWSIGPTKTLYIPAPLLQEGDNVLELLELEKPISTEVHLVNQPQLA